jgi:hypothetical protein
MASTEERAWQVDDGGGVSLRGARCRACGTTLFPPQDYGCTRCGAHGDDLAPVNIPARGALTSFATVHVHRSHPVPFTLGEVVLDTGPVVRAELDPALVPVVGLRVAARALGEADSERLQFGAEEGG